MCGDKNPAKRPEVQEALRRPRPPIREEVREKLRLINLDNRYAAGPHPWHRGNKYAAVPRSEEFRAKLRGSRPKMSMTVVQLILEGKWFQGRVGHFWSAKNGKRFYHRSSYELLAFQWLEKDVTVVSYRYEPFSIPYTDTKGTERLYVPDILVTYRDGRRELIEVGWDVTSETKRLKFEAGRLWCQQNGATFVVWAEKELFQRMPAECGDRVAI
jgi:hypothetical protein